MESSYWSHLSDSYTPMILPKEEQQKIIASRTPEQNEQLNRYNKDKVFTAHSKTFVHHIRQSSHLPHSWRENAQCKGANPEDFFPNKGEVTEVVKRICAKCTVRSDCLEFALEINEPSGVWGGKSALERKRMRASWLRRKIRRKSA